MAKTEPAPLLDMKLSEILLAGMAKDPRNAGRIIAAAIADIKAALDSQPTEGCIPPATGAAPRTPRAAE